MVFITRIETYLNEMTPNLYNEQEEGRAGNAGENPAGNF